MVYKGVLRDEPMETESIFNQNGWLNSWKNGVFSYHHYHSIAHEVLGVVSGSAVLQLGGERGQKFELAAGDVVVLPAGTGHKKISATSDFSVVGAYPGGMDYNLCTGEPDERPRVLEDIRNVPLPGTDPLYGARGPLMDAWTPSKDR
ncbi:cupin domain-containing protein [Paenibacillus sp. HJL G12]|uniref:Cupin domain-containing protein n=2 Tax=Paenibacillus dendrobii TaxID=2691084 RepID=A0A7X3LI02_9BACL|nr:cupin domain-containing protein [Paenibacillus dendrobii]